MEFLFIASRQGKSVSFPLTPGIHACGRHSSCQLRLPSDWQIASGRHLECRIDHSGIAEIRDGVDGAESTNGTIINQHYIQTGVWHRVSTNDEILIGNNPAEAISIRIDGCTNPTLLAPRDSAQLSESTVLLSQLSARGERSSILKSNQTSWNCATGELLIGRSELCHVRLEGPTVSRIHAVIKRNRYGYLLHDRSTNGLFVNGKAVRHSAQIKDGDEIKIATSTFYWQNPLLIQSSLGHSYRIDIRDLSLDGRLEDINLSIEPGQLVSIVGGSGSGKSSLLKTVVGQNPAYTGNILINGREVRTAYTSFKQDIGYVPQDDILHKNLTVEETLFYCARIKLPGAEHHRHAVDRVLQQLELSHRRKMLVSKLSGGQRKRVSIGLELIADPRILLLDEPTSGLDPGLDRKMMDLLRSIADSGKTVALVTHATANVMLCDQIIFLARGGKLCFAGPPSECIQYYNVSGGFPDVYSELDRSDAEINSIRHHYHATQIISLPPVSIGNDNISNTSPWMPPSGYGKRFALFLRQLSPVMEREIKLSYRDINTLIINCLTAPAAIGLCAFASDNKNIFQASSSDIHDISTFNDAISLLLVITCAAAWVGLSSQLQSIIHEKPIFQRERAFNLVPEAYFASKVLALTALASLQSVIIASFIPLFFSAPTNSLGTWNITVGAIMFFTILSLGAQGLMTSSLVRNTQQASSVAPLLLIPQLIFAGVSFRLSANTDWVYFFVSSRWSMRAMGAALGVTKLIPPGFQDKFQDYSEIYKHSWANFNSSIRVIVFQIGVFLALCLFSILVIDKKST